MLKSKVPLLESKISNLESVNSNWKKADSLRSSQILLYQQALISKDADITSLKKSIKKTTYIAGGSVLATIVLALVCTFK